VNRRTFLTVALGSMIASACSKGSSDGATSPTAPAEGETRALTSNEAARMAETLFLNYDLAGATFDLKVQLPDSNTIRLVGEVDWTNHVGHALMTASGREAAITEVYWSESGVLERVPRATEIAISTSRPSFEFIARPPDPANVHLDAMLGVITGLASQQRDNPLLIQQTEGSAWVRSETLRSTEVDVLRYGTRNLYWLDEVGTMLRFEGNTAAGDRPFVIDLLSHEPQDIPGPLVDQVVEIEVIQEIYDAAMMTG
jgi:hypothetical protein